MSDTNYLTYLALGDSYTVGESVEKEQSFPYQLVKELKQRQYQVKDPDVIAVTGWTTGELIAGIADSKLSDQHYDIVTLLIGVNNQYRGGYSAAAYRTELQALLNTAIKYAGGNRQHVFVLSIPDWGVTPFAEGRDRNQIALEIDQFNAINKQEAENAGVNYTDITPISRRAATETGLIAGDGLHPSGQMYSEWVTQLLPMVVKQLKDK